MKNKTKNQVLKALGRKSPCTQTRGVLGILGLLSASLAAAEPAMLPDAGSLMRNQALPAPPPPAAAPKLPLPQSNAPNTNSEDIKVVLKRWKITGNTLITDEDLLESLKQYTGQQLGLKELWQATQTIATVYRERGYLVRAWLPEQEIKSGVVEIMIVEGRLGDVHVRNPKSVISDEKAKGMALAANDKGATLRLDDVERAVLLLNDMPGVSVTPTLKPGKNKGESDLVLDVESHPMFNYSLDYANAGVNAVGEHQFGGMAYVNNAFGVGDQTTMRIQGGSGSVYGRLTYSMPVTDSGLRVGVAGSGMYYTLGNQFKPLDADGDAWIGGTFASYPVYRSSSKNIYTMAGFDTRRYHNMTLGRVQSDKTLNVGYVGVQGDYSDDVLGGGFSNYSFYTHLGDLDLGRRFDYLQNEATDRQEAHSQGAYQKFTFGFSRMQKLPERFSVWANMSGQLATRNLDSSEKFTLGGPYGVRAYPVNEGLADEGYLMNFELRYDVAQQWIWDGKNLGNLQLVGFIDHGGVKLHNSPWAGVGVGPNSYSLSGGGMGINWVSPGDFAVKLSVAQRIGENPQATRNGLDVDGTRETPHFWAQLSKFF